MDPFVRKYSWNDARENWGGKDNFGTCGLGLSCCSWRLTLAYFNFDFHANSWGKHCVFSGQITHTLSLQTTCEDHYMKTHNLSFPKMYVTSLWGSFVEKTAWKWLNSPKSDALSEVTLIQKIVHNYHTTKRKCYLTFELFYSYHGCMNPPVVSSWSHNAGWFKRNSSFTVICYLRRWFECTVFYCEIIQQNVVKSWYQFFHRIWLFLHLFHTKFLITVLYCDYYN